MFRKRIPEQKIIDRAGRTPIPSLTPRQWAERYNPGRFALGGDGSVGAIKKQNIAYLIQKMAHDDGIVYGYHGTSTRNARAIALGGFKNRENDEGGVGVSIADSVVGWYSLYHAIERSHREGATDNGRIIQVRASNPVPDLSKGRLEWLADAGQLEIVGVHTPEQTLEAFRPHIPARNLDELQIRMAVEAQYPVP